MKFSLKELLWSVTFASLGMAAITFIYKIDGAYSHIEVLMLPLLLSLGPLIGTAIGKLFQRAMLGACLGLTIPVLLFFSYLAFQYASWP